MSDKEFLEHLKAREELESRGYTRKPCDFCRGTGNDGGVTSGTYFADFGCRHCDGKGYTWKAPLT